MVRHYAALIWTLVNLPQLCLGQDPQLSQFQASPLYLNPALTGNTLQDRLIANYRMQWAVVPNGFQTYAVSYDHRAAALNSGFGGMIMRDRAGTHGLAFTQASFSYAYEARIDRTHAFRGGIRAGYTIRDYDPGNLLFADQVIRDGAPTSIEPSMIERVTYADLSAGLLYFSEQFWAGISTSHLNRPQQTLYIGGDARLPMRTSVHGGYRFAMDGRHFSKSKTQATFCLHYKAQGKWDQLDLGAYIDHQGLSGGIWYRGLPGIKAYQPGYPNNDALVFLIGYETSTQLQVAYSYDVTVSWLTARSGGAHELSLIYEWPKRQKARKYKVVPCPKF
ncbi:MAG: type IX secretion system membrane protein PorP/SprF [Flavobacteriales bacterium]|nr:type IX secretion system membrane protein PorP/SprF [Flavobacteriales bacterium]